MMIVVAVALMLMQILIIIESRQVLEIQGVNFELVVSSYKYTAVLFYDKSIEGKQLEDEWIQANDMLEGLQEDRELAKIDGSDSDSIELIEAYNITLPSIRVFRNGIMASYTGPYENAKAIADFILDDSEPSVRIVETLDELKEDLKANQKTVVLGFFQESDVTEEYNDNDVSEWVQFTFAADSLRGHAIFYGILSDSIRESFKIGQSSGAVIYMISDDSNAGTGLIPYNGEILNWNLAEWVLRNSAPTMGELSLLVPSGEIYATQFFSSRKLKFILFLRSSDVSPSSRKQSNVLDTWKDISVTFKSKALFSYMVNDAVADVVEYFNIDVNSDLPIIVAHEPSNDRKYKSKTFKILDKESLQDFVTGVVTGLIPHILKSEPIPKSSKSPNFVLQAVGLNVIDIVSDPNKDVLLEVYAPWCEHCKRLRPTYEVLGKAVQGEPRIKIVKIDGTANDLPQTWGVKGYPALLWFPAKDKPYKNQTPIPRSYWEAGQSLHELLSFVQKEGSFDRSTLKVATMEQLSSLLGDEDALRAQFEADDIKLKRNEGRVIFENPIIDYFFGEVCFDGKRYHIVIMGIVILFLLISPLFNRNNNNKQTNTDKKKQ